VNLYIDNHPGAGVGDYIFCYNIALQMGAERIAYHPDNPNAKTLHPVTLDEHLMIYPAASCPEGFLDIFNSGSFYDRLQRPCERLYFPIEERFKEHALTMWGEGRPRVCVVWHGRLTMKRWPGFWFCYRHFAMAGYNVLGLDMQNVSEGYGRALRGEQPLYTVLAVAQTADLCIGFECGPWWAAVANLVPSVGIFPNHSAEQLCFPMQELHYRWVNNQEMKETIYPETISSLADELLEETKARWT
jgi:hypothetical protein